MQNTFSKKLERTDSKGTYAFVSLGCPKNLVDSERMLGLLQLDGYKLVPEASGADFVIVNTCGFIEEARAESFSTIDEMIELKRQGKTRGLIVSGCLAERDKEKLLVARPEIDHLVGVFAREEVTKVADRLIGDLTDQQNIFHPAPSNPLPDRQRLRITPRHFSYIKISEGCDRLCTFCAIPKMRGKHATKPIEEVISEAKELAADGVRELIVVAQDTTYYGIDLYGEPQLPKLLRALNKVDGLQWIRLMYLYPMYFSDEVIGTIADCEKILPYIDMPLQHINDQVLKRMQRRVARAQTEELLDKLRKNIPQLSLRTTMITGFPGETDEQFEDVIEFVRQQKFERLGVFTYSLEPDTPAAKLDGHLPEEIKEQRRNRLMAEQQQIVFEHNQAKVGQQIEVIVDQKIPEAENAWLGRTIADAPDVDSVIYLTGKNLKPGDFVRSEIVSTKDYDLIGIAIDDPY